MGDIEVRDLPLPETPEWTRRRAVHRALKNIIHNDCGFSKAKLQQMIKHEVHNATQELLKQTGGLYGFIENQVLKYAFRYSGNEDLLALVKKNVDKIVRERVLEHLTDGLEINVHVRARPKPKGARRAVKAKKDYPSEG